MDDDETHAIAGVFDDAVDIRPTAMNRGHDPLR